MPLFNRVVEVSFSSGLDASGLRLAFQVRKTTKVNSNTGDVTIWNLSEGSRNSIRELDDTITVKAGYEEDTGARTVYTGEVVRITHSYNPPNIETRIEAGDGVKSLREKRGSSSFGEGTAADTVLKDLAGKMGLTLRPLPDGISDQYVNGFSHSGSIKDALSRITDRLNLEWSIQNNELQILKRRGVLPGGSVPITFETGLLAYPERLTDLKDNLIDDQPKPGWKIKTLLNPLFEPGLKVSVEAGDMSGEFRIEEVTHSGDNWEGDFTSELNVVEL